MAWSVDRLGRSLIDLISGLQELLAAKLDRFLHQQDIDTTTACSPPHLTVDGSSLHVAGCKMDDEKVANMPGETVDNDAPHRAMITACAIGATVLQLLDQTIANVALPYMQGSFSSSFDEITWVLTSYITASAIMTAPVGWLAARYGRKPLYVGCILGFTLASMLCGAAALPWCYPNRHLRLEYVGIISGYNSKLATYRAQDRLSGGCSRKAPGVMRRRWGQVPS